MLAIAFFITEILFAIALIFGIRIVEKLSAGNIAPEKKAKMKRKSK
jgi:hypothetical protein